MPISTYRSQPIRKTKRLCMIGLSSWPANRSRIYGAHEEPSRFGAAIRALQAAIDALILDKFKRTLHVARELSAVAQRLNSSEVIIDEVLKSLEKAKNGLPDLQRNEITARHAAELMKSFEILRPTNPVASTPSMHSIGNLASTIKSATWFDRSSSSSGKHTARSTPAARWLEYFVELQWISGDAVAAFDLLLEGVENAVAPTPTTVSASSAFAN